MRIVVASHNPVKLRAVKPAFRAQFAQVALEIVPVDVPSGVADQPMDDAETRAGACNRAAAARGPMPITGWAWRAAPGHWQGGRPTPMFKPISEQWGA